MNPRRTLKLAIALALLLLLEFMSSLKPAAPTALPMLSKLEVTKVTAISIAYGDVRIRMERDGARRFKLTSPLQSRADFAGVSAIFTALRAGVEMAVRVDDGDLEQYGLTSPNAINLSIEGATALSLIIGNDSVGGTTFVRMSGDDTVYRARIGGRHKYDRQPSSWRNPMIVDIAPELITEVTVRVADQPTLTIKRSSLGLDSDGQTLFSGWAGQYGADLQPDQEQASGLANTIGNLRSGEILSSTHPSGLDTPRAEVEITTMTGDLIMLTVGSTSAGTFISREGDENIYRVSDSLVKNIIRPRLGWVNRAIMTFYAKDLVSLHYTEDKEETILLQDASTSSFKIVKPVNVDTDQRAARFTARKLSALHADQMIETDPSVCGFHTGGAVTAKLLDGSSISFEIGNIAPNTSTPARYVRSTKKPHDIGILNEEIINRLKRGWSL